MSEIFKKKQTLFQGEHIIENYSVSPSLHLLIHPSPPPRQHPQKALLRSS